MATLPELLQTLVEVNGSDLHLTTQTPPQIRVHGKLQTLDLPSLGPAETKGLAYSVLTDAQKKRFEEALELDFSFGIRGLARFRCNVFNQRGAVAAVYRVIPETIKSFNELGLPPDLETIESALRIAETGHLTFATLHTNSAAQTINRIIDVFPAHQQGQIRTQLSLVLEGIVCQALMPRADGQGRVISLEVLIPTPAIRNLIRDDKVHQIYSTMQTCQQKFGMQTMNQSLATLYQRRLITLDYAMGASSFEDELEQMISRGAGVVPGAGMSRGGATSPRTGTR